MKKIYVLIVSVLGLYCCGSTTEAEEMNGLGTIDISPNDSTILFSFFKDDVAGIYESDDAGRSKLVLKDNEAKASYVYPKYSPDGKKIAFVKFPYKKKTSNLFMMDRNGKNAKQLTFGEATIMEIAFSSDGKRIYYCQANEYGSYSPIGRDAAHNMDIYSIEIESLKIRKITSLKSYSVSGISEVNKKYLMFRNEEYYGGGMYICRIDTSDTPRILSPKNNPRGSDSFYYDPVYSPKFNKLAFTAPYEIYIMSLQDKLAEKLYRSNRQIQNLTFYHVTPKLIFNLEGQGNLTIIGMDGKELGGILLKAEE